MPDSSEFIAFVARAIFTVRDILQKTTSSKVEAVWSNVTSAITGSVSTWILLGKTRKFGLVWENMS